LDFQGQVTRWTSPDFQQQEALLETGGTEAGGNFLFPSFSPDGRFLATGSIRGTLKVWDVSRHALWRQWTNTTRRVAPIQFLPDGNKLVTWSAADNLLHEWDLATGLETASWAAPGTLNLDNVGFSPDGHTCVTIGFDGNVAVRNLVHGTSTKSDLNVLEGRGMAFSHDGKLLAIASELGFSAVCDTSTWKPQARLGGLLLGAHSAAFSPNDDRLAIGSDGKEAVKLWDTASWQEVLTLEGEGSLFVSTAFSPDGNIVGSWNGNGILHLWRAPSWDEIHAAEAKDKTEAE
jgi:WD40 repeat protein